MVNYFVYTAIALYFTGKIVYVVRMYLKDRNRVSVRITRKIYPSAKTLEKVIHEMYCLEEIRITDINVILYYADKIIEEGDEYFDRGIYGEPSNMAKRTCRRLFPNAYKKVI